MTDAFEDRVEMQRVLTTIASVEMVTERTNTCFCRPNIRSAPDTATAQARAERRPTFLP